MKKVVCAGLVGALVLLGATRPGEAWHGHAHVFIGPGWWGPPVWVAPYPGYGAPPPVVVVPGPPPAYVEPAPQHWYFCDSPQGYYPQVSQCPGGWREVSPPPPPPAGQ
jgi:hypothetical protein